MSRDQDRLVYLVVSVLIYVAASVVVIALWLHPF